MRLCLEVGGEELDLDVVARDGASVGDLVSALAGEGRDGSGLTVDGRPVPPATPLAHAGLYDGARIALAGAPALVPSAPAGSGIERPADEADEADEANDDPGAPPPADAFTWWRPPRAPLPPPPDPVEPAAEPPPIPDPARLSWPTLVAPFAVAIALAVLLDPRLAVIAVVGPVAQFATWADDRRRLRRQRREADGFRARETARVEREDAMASALAQQRRLVAAPPVGELVEWALTRNRRLWERRPDHPDFLQLRLGALEPDATPIGIDGHRDDALAVARGLVVQAAVLHGPADVGITFATGPDQVPDWDWAKWLPHLESAAPRSFAVVDVRSPAEQRRVLAELRGAAVVVVTGDGASPLPDGCRTVVRAADVLGDGVGEPPARAAARALAPLRDPDADHTSDTTRPRLLPLLEPELEAIRQRFVALLPQVPLGVAADGRPFVVDLARDGPHVLIAGTTGSGKSELLRVLVASLAASAPPEALNFVLVDYKGGSAFDACARLPHTAGVITDLDDDLASRALRCLEAELRYREAELRATGAADIDGHNRARHAAGERPLPRLAVVIDEFAALTDDVPTFIPALVGIAQRGRSLGVHLVLATQRPAGVVSDAIRANIGLCIALRVNDAAESSDVIGVPDAAWIPRDRPGRAIARLDADRLVRFDVAPVSYATEDDGPAVRVRPFVLNGAAPRLGAVAPATRDGGVTDLDVLVDRVATRARERGAPPPRRPWPEPLPALVEQASLGGDGGGEGGAALGLVDDPDRQTQRVYEWPRTNVLACGTSGSGHTDTLVTLAYALARHIPPTDLHVYAIDNAAHALACLSELPHTGAVIGARGIERQLRLLRVLSERAERADADPRPMALLAVADLAALVALLDDPAVAFGREQLARIIATGPDAGVYTAAAAARPGAVPTGLAAGFGARLVFRLADPQDATLFGVHAPPHGAPRGRAVDAGTGLDVQIATDVAPPEWAEVPAPAPPPIATLPDAVAFDDIVDAAAPGPGVWLPIGIADRDLAPCGVLLGPGDHILIAGGVRSGKSSLLAAIAAAARRSDGVDVIAGSDVGRARGPARCLVLIDDADRVDDGSGAIAELIAERRPGVHIVAAARTDALRTAYGHWTRELRAARAGVILCPRPDDGDLFGVLLPRARNPFPTGRGYLVTDGVPELFHAANLRQ